MKWLPRLKGRWGWPQQCQICFSWQCEPICPTCYPQKMLQQSRCYQCALELRIPAIYCGSCLTKPPPFDRVIAAVVYTEPWVSWIKRLKFQSQPELAQRMARIMVDAVQLNGFAYPEADLLLPVPLALPRLRERGYNQAWELTKYISQLTHIQADASLLMKTKHTRAQQNLTKNERQANLKGAFTINERMLVNIKNKTLIIVDDVLTTGATLQEVSQLLKKAGAASVQAWVFARTGRSLTAALSERL